MEWKMYEKGKSIGTIGTENGIIIMDDEHEYGARITLEKDGHQAYSITCGIYGFGFTTFFASNVQDAVGKYEVMKHELDVCFKYIDLDSVSEDEAHHVLCKFIERCESFPEYPALQKKMKQKVNSLDESIAVLPDSQKGNAAETLSKLYVKPVYLIDLPVAGTSYVIGMRELEPQIGIGMNLQLHREPENPHDSLAIVVTDNNGNKLGYIPREYNEILANLMDAGKVLFGEIVEKSFENTWLRISMRVYLEDCRQQS